MAAMPRHREGSPRRRGPPRRLNASLGEPGDNGEGLYGPPRQGVSHLGVPFCLGGGGLHLGMPATT